MCTWSRFSKLMYIYSNVEVYKKQIFQIDVFLSQLRSILELDFLNLCIYCHTQKYTWSRLSKIMNSCSNSEVWSKFPKLMYFISNSEVYLRYTSFQQKSRIRSITEV